MLDKDVILCSKAVCLDELDELIYRHLKLSMDITNMYLVTDFEGSIGLTM